MSTSAMSMSPGVLRLLFRFSCRRCCGWFRCRLVAFSIGTRRFLLAVVVLLLPLLPLPLLLLRMTVSLSLAAALAAATVAAVTQHHP